MEILSKDVVFDSTNRIKPYGKIILLSFSHKLHTSTIFSSLLCTSWWWVQSSSVYSSVMNYHSQCDYVCNGGCLECDDVCNGGCLECENACDGECYEYWKVNSWTMLTFSFRAWAWIFPEMWLMFYENEMMQIADWIMYFCKLLNSGL